MLRVEGSMGTTVKCFYRVLTLLSYACETYVHAIGGRVTGRKMCTQIFWLVYTFCGVLEYRASHNHDKALFREAYGTHEACKWESQR